MPHELCFRPLMQARKITAPLILSVLHFCIGEASVTFLFIQYAAQMRLRQRLGYGKDHHIARTGNTVAVEFGKGGEQTFTGFL